MAGKIDIFYHPVNILTLGDSMSDDSNNNNNGQKQKGGQQKQDGVSLSANFNAMSNTPFGDIVIGGIANALGYITAAVVGTLACRGISAVVGRATHKRVKPIINWPDAPDSPAALARAANKTSDAVVDNRDPRAVFNDLMKANPGMVQQFSAMLAKASAPGTVTDIPLVNMDVVVPIKAPAPSAEPVSTPPTGKVVNVSNGGNKKHN